jgi:hypothetical protein
VKKITEIAWTEFVCKARNEYQFQKNIKIAIGNDSVREWFVEFGQGTFPVPLEYCIKTELDNIKRKAEHDAAIQYLARAFYSHHSQARGDR